MSGAEVVKNKLFLWAGAVVKTHWVKNRSHKTIAIIKIIEIIVDLVESGEKYQMNHDQAQRRSASQTEHV